MNHPLLPKLLRHPTGRQVCLLACLFVSTALTPGHSGPQVVHDPDAQFNLKNAHGMEVRLASYGARITSIKVPDRDSAMADVVLGFDTVEAYRSSIKKPYLGATLGRYAGRIANGRFTLDGVEHVIAKNNGPNHNHGGAAPAPAFHPAPPG